MNKYSYKSKNQSGRTIKGLIEARDERQAFSILREKGLITFSLRPVKKNSFSLILGKLLYRISLGDVANFTRQLSTMITAGLTVDESLSILREQTSPAFGSVIDEVLRDVEGGSSLAESMAKHPRVFDQPYTASIRAGEAAGVLDKVLARLADNLEKKREFNSKVIGAMVYPAIVIVGMGTVGTIMMIFVVPKLLSLYKDFQMTLPAPTRILIAISDFVTKFWWVGIAGMVGGLYLFRVYKSTPTGRRQWDRLMLSLPLIGTLQKQVALTEMTRTLSLLMSAGISIVEALNIVSSSVGNSVYEEALKESVKQVEKGLPLAGTLVAYDEFPPIVPQMISVGEETGKLDDVLAKLSHYFEVESEQMVKGLTTAIEPLIMIVLGVGVGFLIIAVILPMYNLTSSF